MNKYFAFILIDYKLFVLIMEINVNMLVGDGQEFLGGLEGGWKKLRWEKNSSSNE